MNDQTAALAMRQTPRMSAAAGAEPRFDEMGAIAFTELLLAGRALAGRGNSVVR